MSSFTTPARPDFAGRALLVSSRAAEARQIVSAMQRFAFTVDVCTDQESGAALIATRKFQAIILRLGADDQESELLDVVRSSPSNRTVVTFAVLGTERRSRPLNPNFFLHRPLTNALLTSTDTDLSQIRWTQQSDREWSSEWPIPWNGLLLTGNCHGELHWDELNLPALSVDIYSRLHEQELRLMPRIRCFVSVDVGANNSAGRARAFITDINLGGCYVAMATPLPLEAKLTIGVWLDERHRIWADGIVISHHQGLGIGS